MNHTCVAPALALVLAAAFSASAFAQVPADRIWSGGSIVTMNDKALRAEAVAERGGRIVAVGTRVEIMKLRGPGTQLIDLGGRAMLPGFVDAHGHVLAGGMQALSANLLAPPDGNVKDIASLQKGLREWMAANEAAVRKVNLIIGFGYDESTLAEQRHPTRDDLDQVSKDIPILLIHQSGHMSAVNSKALEISGTTAASVDPKGGLIRRQEGSKEPNGVFEEAAHFPMAVKLLTQVGPEGAGLFFRAGTELWARFGYTTAQDGRATEAAVAVMRQVAKAGDMKVDVVTYPDVMGDREFIKKNVSTTYVDRIRVAGAKLTIDGSPQGFTAWRDKPYYKPLAGQPVGYSGYSAITPDQAIEAVDWAYANNVQILAHANGEAAGDLLIASHTLARLKHGAGKDRRPVLIHGQFTREDQVEAYKRLDVIPSLFPMHTFYWGDWHTNRTVGPVAGANISPTGWVRKRGMIFTTHHDAPVAFPDSMRVLDATVTRRARGSGKIIGPAQRVDVVTALKAMTIWPAYQHFEEASKGSIEVGKLADFVILSRDPTKGDVETIDRIKITETIKEGSTIYKLTPQEQRKAALGMATGKTAANSFARFLVASAEHRDADVPWALPKSFAASRLVSARHDQASCLVDQLNKLTSAMLTTAIVR
jgi:predicted amidohydrolase YtcJ